MQDLRMVYGCQWSAEVKVHTTDAQCQDTFNEPTLHTRPFQQTVVEHWWRGLGWTESEDAGSENA